MTEIEKPKPAVDPELLPEEIKGPFLEQLSSGQIEQPDFSPKNKEEKEKPLDDEASIGEYLRREGLKNYRNFAQFDTYSIEMKDGSFQKYTRRSISDDEFEEIEDLRAETEAGYHLNEVDQEGKPIPLSRIEIRQRDKLLERKKAEYYLINQKTKKPMTLIEKRNVRHAYVINGILNACILRTKSDAVEGKK